MCFSGREDLIKIYINPIGLWLVGVVKFVQYDCVLIHDHLLGGCSITRFVDIDE